MQIVALYTVWYNFIRIHKTLKVNPARQAGAIGHGNMLLKESMQTYRSRDRVGHKKEGRKIKPRTEARGVLAAYRIALMRNICIKEPLVVKNPLIIFY